MRVHLDKKPSNGVAIGFFVITLLSPFALAILLSNANAFFEADPVAVEDLRPGTLLERWQLGPIVWKLPQKGVPLRAV
jgi:hypothetical protein